MAVAAPPIVRTDVSWPDVCLSHLSNDMYYLLNSTDKTIGLVTLVFDYKGTD